MSVLRFMVPLLAVIVLTGCEEVMAPKAASTPVQEAPLYTEIGADQLIERWGVLPNGAIAAGSPSSTGYRLASATEGFSGLPSHFTFSDAREYGSCVVFTVLIIATYLDHEENVVEVEIPMHVLDCVGEPVANNDGLFHVAQMCEVYPDFIGYIVRAGNSEPTITKVEYDHYTDGTVERIEYVNVEISMPPYGTTKSWDDFTWNKTITPYPWDGEPILVYWASGAKWPGDDGKLQHDMELERISESTHLHFSIDDNHGIVKFEDNDGAAYEDHNARCATIPRGEEPDGPGPPGPPDEPTVPEEPSANE